MRGRSKKNKTLIQSKNTTSKKQTSAKARKEMNGTSQRYMYGCIAEMTKLLIWSKNTYKQKKKQE
jgi:hypothetical protein